MNEEENEFLNDPLEASATPQAPEPVIREEEFTEEPIREVYEDAHFEPEEENTRPPRYYTPPEKSQKENKVKKEKPDGAGRVVAIICAVLIAALLGGLVGSVLTRSGLNDRMEAMETSLASYEAALEEVKQSSAAAAEQAELASVASTEFQGLLPSDIYDMATKQVVGIRTEVTVTNFFGMTSSGAVSGSGFIISEDGYILTN